MLDPVMGRFWSKVSFGRTVDECWPWAGSNDSLGYGRFNFEGKTTYAHRVAYTLSFGPISTGMHVLHKCDNPRCVNPKHLELGTHVENMRQRGERGRTATGRRDAPAFSDEDTRQIREALLLGLPRTELAVIFGVSYNNMRKLCKKLSIHE